MALVLIPYVGWSQPLPWRAPDHAGQIAFRNAEMIVTIVDPGQRLPGSAGDVVVVVEADPRQGTFGSLKSRMDIDCDLRRVLLQRVERYSQPGLTGKSQVVVARPQWIRPMPSAYLGKVISASCGGSVGDPENTRAPESADGPQNSGEAPRRAAVNPTLPPAQASHTNDAPAAALPLKIRPAPAPTVIAPRSSPVEIRTTASADPALEGTSTPPKIKTSSEITELRPKPIGVKGRQIEPIATAGAAKGGAVVQVISSSSRAAARSELHEISQAHSTQIANKTTQITQAQVNGATFYRGRIGGFSDSKTAQKFCSSLKATGFDCYVVGQGR